MAVVYVKDPVCFYEMRAENVRILLVEDDPANILVEGTFLENIGYAYDVASSGAEVLEKVQATPYSLILMDLKLPDMSGLIVTQQLRAMEKKGLIPRIPIVAMTARALLQDRKICLNMGMDDYLPKPFSQGQLQGKIEQNIFLSYSK
ncbi:MAG: response regulator [Alphaproteobacteria bacterium]|nr:response regulator [Alphaproteobacteria bacterium]